MFKSVYDDPDEYLEFLLQADDSKFESQNFERKQVGEPSGGRSGKKTVSKAQEHVEKTMSGFANANGGLLILGISDTGEAHGIGHLNEEQKTALLDVSSLKGANIYTKLHTLATENGERDIALFVVDRDDRRICTRVRDGAAWIRQGASTVRLSDDKLDHLKRDRGIVAFERSVATEFYDKHVDKSVVGEFLKSREMPDDENLLEPLSNAGAVIEGDGKNTWTNAGLLFFASNPQRIFGYAHVRLLRFDCPYADEDERPTPDFDRDFDGSLTQQIRDMRTFVQESGFFKKIEERSDAGGFVSEPEYPEIAVDEAIVNAIAHRDYAIGLPIICEKYIDAFVVKSPGSLRQPEDVPNEFSLVDVKLASNPRNPTLMGWLRGMKDAKGSSYVKALREGTRRMRDEMEKLHLPPPTYKISELETVVVLENDLQRRAAKSTGLAGDKYIASNEYANLYRLDGLTESGTKINRNEEKRVLLQKVCDDLESLDWIVSTMKMGRAVVHRKGTRKRISHEVDSILSIIPAYILNIRSYYGRYYLVVDYTVEVLANWRASKAVDKFGAENIEGLSAFTAVGGTLVRGKITKIGDGHIGLRTFDSEDEIEVVADDVYPKLRIRQLKRLLKEFAPEFDLAKEIKSASLSNVHGAAHKRVELISRTVEFVADRVFPITVNKRTVTLSKEPLRLVQNGDGRRAWRVKQVDEPAVEFRDGRVTANIREGITDFGSYKNRLKTLEIIGVIQSGYDQQLRELVSRLQSGSYRFKGMESTFETRLNLAQIVTLNGESAPDACRQLIEERPEWIGNKHLNRLFLVHTPEADYAADDVASPYYQSKRILLESGLPCQMVDTDTLRDPDYKDLNLALNIVAKSGGTPWILPESIPDADFFVGLSYTSNHEHLNSRIIGFANVFNQYGRWEFYSSGVEAVPYDERTRYYERLVQRTLSRLDLREHPTVYFHYSAKFSRSDRKAILQGARKVRPHGKYVFVWINTHHPVRLFDERKNTDGAMSRGRYAIGSRNQIYLSTTGNNLFRKTLGTPHMLEINVYEDDETQETVDLQSIAKQMLSLTKLNWASTDALCGTPITIKYASSAAYLTGAFQRQDDGMGRFRVHEALERTPWFI